MQFASKSSSKQRWTESGRLNNVGAVKPDELLAPKPFSFVLRALLVLLIVLIYLFAAHPFMNLLGKWPAPYWLSAGLGVLLLFGLAGKQFRQLLWIIPTSVLGYLVAWFFNGSINWLPFSGWLYHHAKWYFQSNWADKIPIAIFMATVAIS